jgi:photosynthetic reaction center H subunit
VVVRSLHERHFEGIPPIAASDRITLLEEEKIMAWVAGGTLYADASRVESVL